ANQPGLREEVERFFADAPPGAIDAEIDLDKGHGRIEDRRVFVSRDVDWLNGQRRFPGEHRFPRIAALAKIETRTELKDRCRRENRYFVASRPLTPKQLAQAVRGPLTRTRCPDFRAGRIVDRAPRLAAHVAPKSRKCLDSLSPWP